MEVKYIKDKKEMTCLQFHYKADPQVALESGKKKSASLKRLIKRRMAANYIPKPFKDKKQINIEKCKRYRNKNRVLKVQKEKKLRKTKPAKLPKPVKEKVLTVRSLIGKKVPTPDEEYDWIFWRIGRGNTDPYMRLGFSVELVVDICNIAIFNYNIPISTVQEVLRSITYDIGLGNLIKKLGI